MDGAGTPHYVIKGYWDEQFTIAKVLSGEGKNLQTAPPASLWRADPIQ